MYRLTEIIVCMFNTHITYLKTLFHLDSNDSRCKIFKVRPHRYSGTVFFVITFLFCFESNEGKLQKLLSSFIKHVKGRTWLEGEGRIVSSFTVSMPVSNYTVMIVLHFSR